MPTMRGRNQLEAASGTMPRWENTKPKRAFSDAMRISIASCMVTPMPTAGPFTAAVKSVGAGGEVGAGTESASCAGDDDGADIVVLVGRIESVDQFLLHSCVEGIEFVRPVQGDGEDLLGHLVFDRFIRHGVFPLGCCCLETV